MTIEAELPNGTILEFPDGTSDQIIQNAVKSQLGITKQAAQPLPADIAPAAQVAPSVLPVPTPQQQVVTEQPQQQIAPAQPVQQPVLAGERFGPGAVRIPEPERIPTRAETELPELGRGGLLAGEDPAKSAAITPALLTTTNPAELGQILQSNFPNIGIQSDEAGNLIATNNTTGVRVVLNQPGLSALDIIQGGALAAAFTPAGRAATVPIAGLRAGLTEAGLQAVQAVSGGEFNAEDVALAATAGAAGQKLSDIIASAPAARPSAQTAAQRATAQGVDEIPGPSTDEQRRTLAATISKGKAQDIAAEVVPDQKIIDAADELGVDILPSASSQNLIFRELEQGLKSVPGSQLKEREAAGITTLAQKADDLITEFGGSLDKSQVGLDLEKKAIDTIEQMRLKAKDIYDNKLAKLIPPKALTPGNEVLAFIRNKADEFGGLQELTPLERNLLERLDPATNPTYARVDNLRKKIGNAKRGKGEEIFISADKGLLTKLESLILNDQKKTAAQFNAGELFDSARTLVAQRKILEEDLKVTFGQKLQKDILPTVGRSLKELGKGSFKPFRDIISRVPKENRQEVVLTALNDVFTLGSRKEQQLSLAGFDDWYKGLQRNKEAFKLLKDNLPEGASKRLDLIATVAGGIRKAQESEIKTGRILAVPELFDRLETKLGRIFGVALKAGAAEVPGTAVGLPGVASATVITNALARGKTPRSQAADELLASPLFKRTLEVIATRGEQIAADQAEKLAKTKAFKAWMKTIPATEARAISDVGFVRWLSSESPEARTEETRMQQSQ